MYANYRLTVTSTLSSLHEKILKHRIENEYNTMEIEKEAEFRAEMYTIDHLFTTIQVKKEKTVPFKNCKKFGKKQI